VNHRLWAAFGIVQLLGQFCSWVWPYILSFWGPVLWVSGQVLLLPGDILSGWLIQATLWTSSLTALQLRLIQSAVETIFNAAVCFIAVWGWRRTRRLIARQAE
jgi:hypothetical protein